MSQLRTLPPAAPRPAPADPESAIRLALALVQGLHQCVAQSGEALKVIALYITKAAPNDPQLLHLATQTTAHVMGSVAVLSNIERALAPLMQAATRVAEAPAAPTEGTPQG